MVRTAIIRRHPAVSNVVSRCEDKSSADPNVLRERRLLRHCYVISRHLDAGDVDAAERAIREYQQLHNEPDSEWEQWRDSVDLLIANPPPLHPGEAEFLQSMARQLSQRGCVPTEKQARWIRLIERRQHQNARNAGKRLRADLTEHGHE